MARQTGQNESTPQVEIKFASGRYLKGFQLHTGDRWIALNVRSSTGRLERMHIPFTQIEYINYGETTE